MLEQGRMCECYNPSCEGTNAANCNWKILAVQLTNVARLAFSTLSTGGGR